MPNQISNSQIQNLKMKRRLEIESKSSPNSTHLRINHTSDNSQPPLRNTHNAARRPAKEERGKAPARGEEPKKGKRPKVEVQDVDEKNVIVIDDDLDDHNEDEYKFDEELQVQEVLFLSMGIDNSHGNIKPDVEKSWPNRTDAKGKKQVKFPRSKTEPGQSSRIPNTTMPSNFYSRTIDPISGQSSRIQYPTIPSNFSIPTDPIVGQSSRIQYPTIPSNSYYPGIHPISGQSSRIQYPTIPSNFYLPTIDPILGQSSRIQNPRIPRNSYSRTEPIGISTIQKPTSKIEPGQSSRIPNPKTTNPTTIKQFQSYCKICMEFAPLARTFTVNPCNHVFCNSCTIHYISSKIRENISRISCPSPDCKVGFMDPVLCREILPKDIFEKWGLVLYESSVGVDKKFYCPFKDCSVLLLHEGDEITNSECPHCNRMFCARCKVPWHGDMSCEEFQNLGKNESVKEDLMLINLAKNKKWQRCPHCRMYVEKTEGCMFMRCRCGYNFCYVCASPMDMMTYYCTKCRR